MAVRGTAFPGTRAWPFAVDYRPDDFHGNAASVWSGFRLVHRRAIGGLGFRGAVPQAKALRLIPPAAYPLASGMVPNDHD